MINFTVLTADVKYNARLKAIAVWVCVIVIPISKYGSQLKR